MPFHLKLVVPLLNRDSSTSMVVHAASILLVWFLVATGAALAAPYRAAERTTSPGVTAASAPGTQSPQLRSEGAINSEASNGPAVTFDFENEPVHVAIKAIIGDMLGENYFIAPGVKGTITLSTAKPISRREALDLLEMALGWNNARISYERGRYIIAPSDQLPDTTPSIGERDTSGFHYRVFELTHISPSEMAKALKPYARPDAIISIDDSRSALTLAGTRLEMENYAETIQTFDIDWLSGMSVSVFQLNHGKPSRVVRELEAIFGEQSRTPMAGLVRFMALDSGNTILVLTRHPDHLETVREWIQRLELADGDILQLFYYELKYIQADVLATRLLEALGSSDDSFVVAPIPHRAPANASEEKDTEAAAPFTNPVDPTDQQEGASLSVSFGNVRVSSANDNNTLIVRCTAYQWQSIKRVIEQLDVMPLQVLIEAQVVSVNLSGELRYGVNWYFNQAVSSAGLPDATDRSVWGSLSGAVTPQAASWTFLGKNAAAVVTALDAVSDIRILQSPSVLVRNNAEATLNVGSRIPVSSVTINPGLGEQGAISQVQYMDTGVTLRVRPRAGRNGHVVIDIMQEISSAAGEPDQIGNVRINTRKLKTEVALQAGDTLLLSGLIDEVSGRSASGFPGLSRIPLIGGLFGTTGSATRRDEVVLLLTATIVESSADAAKLTEDYGRRFRAMEPLRRSRRLSTGN